MAESSEVGDISSCFQAVGLEEQLVGVPVAHAFEPLALEAAGNPPAVGNAASAVQHQNDEDSEDEEDDDGSEHGEDDDGSEHGEDDDDGGDGAHADEVEHDVSWCQCGHCVWMPTEAERRCCKSYSRIREKLAGPGGPYNCASQHDDFKANCLQEGVMAVDCHIKIEKEGPMDDLWTQDEIYRHLAYVRFIYWVYHGMLGKGNRRVIPSCCVHLIRSKWPSSPSLGNMYIIFSCCRHHIRTCWYQQTSKGHNFPPKRKDLQPAVAQNLCGRSHIQW